MIPSLQERNITRVLTLYPLLNHKESESTTMKQRKYIIKVEHKPPPDLKEKLTVVYQVLLSKEIEPVNPVVASDPDLEQITNKI